MALAVPPLSESLSPPRLRLRDLFVGVGGAVAGMVVAFILLVAVTIMDKSYLARNPVLLVLLATIMIYVFMGAAMALVLRRLPNPRAFLGLRMPTLRTLPLLAGLLLVWLTGEGFLVYLTQLVLNHGQEIKGNTAEMFAGQPLGPGLLVLALLGTSVAAPIAEEIFFRGMLYRYLRQSWPIWPAAIVSALVFGLLHFFPMLLPVFIFWGILLAIVYERTGSLTNTILLHSAGNAIATLLVYLSLTRGGV